MARSKSMSTTLELTRRSQPSSSALSKRALQLREDLGELDLVDVAPLDEQRPEPTAVGALQREHGVERLLRDHARIDQKLTEAYPGRRHRGGGYPKCKYLAQRGASPGSPRPLPRGPAAGPRGSGTTTTHPSMHPSTGPEGDPFAPYTLSPHDCRS